MKFEKTLSVYIEKLNGYTEEKFLQKPEEHSWSLGQVYVHLLLGHEHFFMKQADKCLNQDETVRGKGKNWNGKIIFFINGFPNIKFKMPKRIEVPPRQPENIEYVKLKLERAAEQALSIASRLDSYDKNEKTKHPAFGYFNAKEWYRMSEMHFRHHLRQLKRTEKIVGV